MVSCPSVLFSQVKSHLVLLSTCLRAGREAGSHLLQRGRGHGFTGSTQSPIQFLEGKPGVRETHLPHTTLGALPKEQGQKDSEEVFVGEKALSPLFDNGKQLWH